MVGYNEPYDKPPGHLSNEETGFFVAGRNLFRRTEINELTTPELLDLPDRKIRYEPIRPSVDKGAG